MRSLRIILLIMTMLMPAASVLAQYDRAVVSLTRLDYVYYNIDNPMSVSVPGLMPKDISVNIGEERAFLHRDPDGSNVNDFIVRPKDSTGTITVHVNEKLENGKTRSRGMLRFRVITIPDPVVWLGYVRQGDTVSLDDLINKSYIQVKAKLEDFNFPLDEPEVVSYEINRSESFSLPIEVQGAKLSQQAKDMLAKARRDETLYIENIKVLMPDGRTITLQAQFPLK